MALQPPPPAKITPESSQFPLGEPRQQELRNKEATWASQVSFRVSLMLTINQFYCRLPDLRPVNNQPLFSAPCTNESTPASIRLGEKQPTE